MENEPHWILKGLFAALLGAIPWAAIGFILNVLVPIIGLVICCGSLNPTYYQFAYWLPLAVSGVVVVIVLAAWTRDPSSTKSRSELARESIKGAILVITLCLSVMAWTGRLI